MKSKSIGALIAVTLALCAPGALAQSSARQSFDRLKTLTGKWQGKDTLGHRVKVAFRLTGKGSALMSEFIEQGENEDMITMIHLDGGRLLATHYCSAGNQPRMSGTVSADGKTISFDFVDGTNIPSPESGHMLRLVIRLLSPGRHIEEWTYVENGKEDTVVSDLRRIGAQENP